MSFERSLALKKLVHFQEARELWRKTKEAMSSERWSQTSSSSSTGLRRSGHCLNTDFEEKVGGSRVTSTFGSSQSGWWCH